MVAQQFSHRPAARQDEMLLRAFDDIGIIVCFAHQPLPDAPGASIVEAVFEIAQDRYERGAQFVGGLDLLGRVDAAEHMGYELFLIGPASIYGWLAHPRTRRNLINAQAAQSLFVDQLQYGTGQGTFGSRAAGRAPDPGKFGMIVLRSRHDELQVNPGCCMKSRLCVDAAYDKPAQSMHL